MNRIYLPLILFVVVVLEGVALNLLPSFVVMGKTFIVPHWALIILLYYALFYDRQDTYYSVIYAGIFGLLIDIVYTSVLGVYMFSYALVIFLIHSIRNRFHGNLYAVMLLGILGIGLADGIISIVYALVGLSNMSWQTYLLHRLLPTELANLLFLLVAYPLLAARLQRWQNELPGHTSI